MKKKGFTLIELMIVIAIIAIIAAIAIPSLLSSRKSANETSAVATLKALFTAETQFRIMRKNGRNYGTFTELSQNNLYIQWEAYGDFTGVKAGYQFWLLTQTVGGAGATVAKFQVIATPAGNEEGDRAFMVNQDGQIYYTTVLPPSLSTATWYTPNNPFGDTID